jgi:hypothetical protein
MFKFDENARIFKCPEYPLNEFKLISYHDNKDVAFDIYVSGPTIPDFHVKISKKNGEFSKIG